MVWTLIAGFLVMFMQAGFAMVETGLCRSKNAAHTISMNFMIYPLGCIAFWAYGFALGWGNWFNGPVVRQEFVDKFDSDGVRGLFYGDTSQLWMQLLDAAVVAVFGFIMAYAWFKLSNLITPIRVSAETEMGGLDGPEMGAMGYPDFTITGKNP